MTTWLSFSLVCFLRLKPTTEETYLLQQKATRRKEDFQLIFVKPKSETFHTQSRSEGLHRPPAELLFVQETGVERCFLLHKLEPWISWCYYTCRQWAGCLRSTRERRRRRPAAGLFFFTPPQFSSFSALCIRTILPHQRGFQRHKSENHMRTQTKTKLSAHLYEPHLLKQMVNRFSSGPAKWCKVWSSVIKYAVRKCSLFI